MALPNPYVRRWDPRTRETYYEHQVVAEVLGGVVLSVGSDGRIIY